MGKVIPYQGRRFKPLDFVRVDEKTSPNGQMNLFDSRGQEETTLLPISDNSFDLALKLDLRNDPGAERFYLRSIEKNENIAHAYCNLGVLAAHKENMIEAVDYFTKALAEDPRHVETHFNLANVFFAVGNHHLAIFHYRLVNRIAPDFADGYFNLGLTLLETEDLINARDAFIQYQKLSPLLKSEQVTTILKSLASLI